MNPIDLKAALAERRKSAEEALRINLCLSRGIVEEFEDLAAQRAEIVAPFEKRRNQVARRLTDQRLSDDQRMGSDPVTESAAIDAEQAEATSDIDAQITDLQARGTEHTVQLVFAVIAPSQYQSIVNQCTTSPGEIDTATFFPALAKEAFRRVEQAGATVDLGTWDEISESLSFGEVDAIRQQVWMANRGTVAAPFSRKSSANSH